MAITIITNTPEGPKTETFENFDAPSNKQAEAQQKEDNNAKPDAESETSTKTANVDSNTEVMDEEDDEFGYLDKDETEENEESTEDDEDSEDETVEDKNTKKSGFKKRIDRLTREKNELARERNEMMERLASLEAKLNPNSNNDKPAHKEETLVKPKLDDFETIEQFVEALSDYKVNLVKKELEEAEKKAKIDQEANKKVKEWQEKVNNAKSKYKDWANVEKAEHIPLTVHMRSEIMDSELGADIVYYLYKNPDKAEEISKMNVSRQVKEIGRIEAKLEARLDVNKGKEPKKISKAPAPVKPITNSAASVASVKKDPSKMSFAEYEAWYNKEIKRK